MRNTSIHVAALAAGVSGLLVASAAAAFPLGGAAIAMRTLPVVASLQQQPTTHPATCVATMPAIVMADLDLLTARVQDRAL